MTNEQGLKAPKISEAILKKLRLPATSQLGFVVRDTDETARYYEQVFGVGPWSIMVGETTDCTNRGKPATIRGKIGVTQVGPVQFELIQILEGESIHSEFLRERGEGLHHVGFHVRDLEARLGLDPRLEGRERLPIPTLGHSVMNLCQEGDSLLFSQ